MESGRWILGEGKVDLVNQQCTIASNVVICIAVGVHVLALVHVVEEMEGTAVSRFEKARGRGRHSYQQITQYNYRVTKLMKNVV